MSILTALFDVIKGVIRSVFNFLKDILKKYWFVIVMVALCYYFGPQILSYMQSSGVPSWLVSATESLIGGVNWVVDGAFSMGKSLWAALGKEASSWTLGNWATALTGVGMLLAPEETVALLGEVANAASTVAGGVLDAVVSSPFGMGVLALGIWYFFFRDRSETVVVRDTVQNPILGSTGGDNG